MTSWSDPTQSFLTGDNALYVARLYASYVQAPGNVSPEWGAYFAELHEQDLQGLKGLLGPSWSQTLPLSPEENLSQASSFSKGEILDSIRALRLIRAYRARGHMVAHLDPLGLTKQELHPELDPRTYHFTEADYDRPIFIDDALGLTYATLREILARLHQAYCGTIGVEFLHIQDPSKKLWLQKRIEGEGEQGIGAPLQNVGWKKNILEGLLEAELFEQFLHKKYPAAKRFGLDGGESLIPGLNEVLRFSSTLGVNEVVIGMSHRGRLNVLTNVLGKPSRAIFSEFQGKNPQPDQVQGSGDVKYHLGASTDREFDGKKVHISLTANPSHLEAVNPVVLGKVRAKQAHLKDQDRMHVMGLLLHGDAAFSGQGIVAETFMLSQLHGYRTGGTLHVIINNQIGFTTSPNFAHSAAQCSDQAMVVQAPIFHVNGDDPEAVVKVMHLAAEYRHTFGSDVLVDLVCYRRFGHNEADEPAFTQPLMYHKIAEHETIGQLYAKQLVAEKSFTQEEISAFQIRIEQTLQASFQDAETYRPSKADWLEGKWTGLGAKCPTLRGEPLTGVKSETLLRIGTALSQIPEEFHLHPKLIRVLSSRLQRLTEGQSIDWSTAESLAFASLLEEGHRVRLSGQDSGRGTFSQRHAVLRDQKTDERYMPLAHLSRTQGTFEVWDSPLAEASVLGFELGYSLADPYALVMWEAQFGDFANGAQVIMDQFISVGESKWLRMSGLVQLLPHGYEGQGPEHSSARLERYLQLCAEDNMQIVNCTTPANFFHVLRRQLHRPYRKPLIVLTPKSLLRHKRVVSELKAFELGSHFLPIIPDDLPPDSIKRMILCSGKVYYDLLEAREAKEIQDVGIVRLEELYPFPHEALVELLKAYRGVEIIWCQEEPKNMGAWIFLDRRLEAVAREAFSDESKAVLYVGRAEAASPATGLLTRHLFEQAQLIDQALGVIEK